MPSLQSRQVERLAKLIQVKRDYETAEPDIRVLRRFDYPAPPVNVRWQCPVRTGEVEGFRYFTLEPGGCEKRARLIYYLHGGGYAAGPSWLQWHKLAELATGLSVRAVLLDYPKAPEHQAELTLRVATSAYLRLREEYPEHLIALLGDSAGAGLAAALAMKWRDEGLPLPERLVLLSPYVDVSLTHPGIESKEKEDPLLSAAGLRALGKLYAGRLGLTDPRISPLYGDFAGLPPMHVFVGTADILMPDTLRFAERAIEAGVEVDYHEYEGMMHNWILAPVPEAKRATRAILECL